MFKKFLNGCSQMCMEEAGSGGAGGGSGAEGAGAGNKTGGEGAAGDKGAGAGTGDKGTGAGGNTPALAWHPNATADDVAFAQSKGWDKSANPTVDVFNSYKNLQTLFGADKAGKAVVVPDDSADQKVKDAFYNRLGRPDAPDKYSAKTFTGLDEDGVKSLRQSMFDAGMTDKQAQALEKWNNDTAKGYEARLAEAGKIELAQQQDALKKEWGAAYEQNVQIGKEAAKQMGWSDDQINGLQAVLGFDGIMKLAHTIGQKVGEGQFVSGDSGRSGGTTGVMTPDQARRELNNLTNDQNFMKAWSDKAHPGHTDAVNKKSQLSKWSVGSK